MKTRWIFYLMLLVVTGSAHAQLYPRPTKAPVIRALDPRFSQLVPEGVEVEKIVEGHEWVEGPVWVRNGGYLLFSDVVKNAIYRWKEGEGEEVLAWSSLGTATGRSPASSRTAASRSWPIAMKANG